MSYRKSKLNIKRKAIYQSLGYSKKRKIEIDFEKNMKNTEENIIIAR